MAFMRELAMLRTDLLIAPESCDVELTSLLAYQCKIPFAYRDEETGEIRPTLNIRGSSSILIIDRIDDFRALRDTIRQAATSEGEVTAALCRYWPSSAQTDELRKLGVKEVRTVLT